MRFGGQEGTVAAKVQGRGTATTEQSRPIIHINANQAHVVRAEMFALEARLQDTLEQHPEILWLGDIVESAPKLVTIGREVSVPSGAIDLLFLGSDGVLTVVETKLRRNQESRREVVAQVLEYGSYVATWSSDQLASVALAYLSSQGQHVADFWEWAAATFDLPADEAFAQRVEASLTAGRLRLVIAVDEMSDPLRSLVTFVNRHSEFTLLVLGVTTYPLAHEQHVVVPLLFGYSPQVGAASGRTAPRDWVCDRATMVESAAKLGPGAVELVGRLFDLAEHTYTLRPGISRSPSFIADARRGGRRDTLFIVDPARGQLTFIPSGIDRLPESERPGPFERGLRDLFGPALATGAKAYYFWVPFASLSGRFEQLQAVLEQASSKIAASDATT